MSESVSQLAREARSVQQTLKELLKTHDPWAKEVEFQRKNLRRLYLRLLIVHPYAKESKDAETHLWMQTSHSFISYYKQHILALERAVHTPPARNNNQSSSRHPGGHGPVEYRKLLQRFRQFLAEEERFWIQLVLRFRRSFDLVEAQPALVALGIAEDANIPSAADQEPASPPSGRSNLGFFPPEDPSIPVLPVKPEQHKSQLVILSKALVCLGDLARYKELYNDSGGRPRAGHEDGPVAVAPKRGGRNRKGGTGATASAPEQPPTRERNYDKAQKYYEQARALVPDEGNPSHQLAILAMYKKDTFASLVHYYKALCVQQPYDTASENLGSVLNKALDQWRRAPEKPKEMEPRHKVAAFKQDVLVLHALWRLGVKEMELMGPQHAEELLANFSALLSDRVLPIETIRDVVMLAQGALLKHRKFRGAPVSSSSKRSSGASDHVLPSPSVVESQIATHVVALHRVLMQIGITQLAEKPPEDAVEGDLAQKITAVFRRTLPALRIAGKWLRANLPYVLQRMEHERDGKNKTNRTSGVVIGGAEDFWTAYTRFMTALLRAFPLEKLPALSGQLEEDVDLTGFVPLKRFLRERRPAGAGKGEEKQPGVGEQVHPNDEQLMRIADILADAKAIAEIADSPIIVRGYRFSFEKKGEDVFIFKPQHVLPAGHLQSYRTDGAEPSEDEDMYEETMTEASRTDDDPVREAGDAFRQGLGCLNSDLEDDEEDEIVWNPRPTLLSPIGPAKATSLPSPPAVPRYSPPQPAPAPRALHISPIGPSFNLPSLATSPKAPAIQGTTAQDLLNMMGVPRTSNGGDLRQMESSTPQAELLFGSSSKPSIWSAGPKPAQKYSGLGVGNSPGQYFSQQQHTRPLSMMDPGLSPSSLPSTFAQPSQNSQNHMIGALPSSFVPQPQAAMGGGHQRSASLNTPSQALFSNQSPAQRYDPFGGYDPLPNQQPLGRLPGGQLPQTSAAAFSNSPVFPNSRGGFMDSRPEYRDVLPYQHDLRTGQVFTGSLHPRPISQSWDIT